MFRDMKNRNVQVALALALAVLTTVAGCKLTNGDRLEETKEVEARYVTKDGNLLMPDKGVSALAAKGEIAFAGDRVKTLNIDWVNDTVTIETYDGAELIISEISDKTLNDSTSLHYVLSPEGELSIVFCKPGVELAKDSVPVKHLYVCVPRGLKLDELRVEGMVHTLQMERVESRDFEYRGLLASLLMSGCEVDNMEVSVANTLSFEARFGRMPDKIDLNSEGCMAVLYVPEDAGITFDKDGVWRLFSCDLPVARKGKKHVVGDGRCQLEMDRHNASLAIKTQAPGECGAETLE